MVINNPHLAVIFVFYNEEENVEHVVGSMVDAFNQANFQSYRLILVDNGSTDKTEEKIQSVLASNMTFAQVKNNVGFGGGVLEGARHTADCTHIAICDGDGQIDPKDVIRLFQDTDWQLVQMAKALRTNRADNLWRLVMSRLFNFIFRKLLHCNSSDFSGKPKIMTRELFDRLDLESEDFFIDMEIMGKAAALQIPYKEMPTTFLPRHGGDSKVGFFAGLSVIAKCLQWSPKLGRMKRSQQLD